MMILTPIVHKENVWQLDVRGELSLRGSDCKMNLGFDFSVIQGFVIIYLAICGCLCVCILVWVYYMCGFVWRVQCCLRTSCLCVSKQFGTVPLMFACIFFPFYALGLSPSGEPCSVLFQSHFDPTPCPPSRYPSL